MNVPAPADTALTPKPLKIGNTLGIFNADEYFRAGLSLAEGTILKWVLGFALSGEMKENTESAGYFWVRMEKAAVECGLSVRQTQRALHRLCGKQGKGEKLFPAFLFDKVTNTRSGRYTYYAFNRDMMLPLLASDFTTKYNAKLDLILSDIKINVAKIAEKQQNKKEARIINTKVWDIFQMMKSYTYIEDGKEKPIFKTQLPEDISGDFKKTANKAGRKIRLLHEGKFCAEYFTADNNIPEEVREKINSVKGNWKAVYSLIEEALQSYKEKTEFTAAQRDINEFLFNDYLNYSELATHLTDRRETIADKIYMSECITDRMAELAEKMCRDSYNQVQFWSRIKSIGQWYDSRIKLLKQVDRNVGYWTDGGKDKWFQKYTEFLNDLTQGYKSLTIKHIGTDCATWYSFCDKAEYKHEIEIDMNMDIDTLINKVEKIREKNR